MYIESEIKLINQSINQSINILFAPKNDNDQKNEERKYNGLKEKIFTNKMVHQFQKYLD